VRPKSSKQPWGTIIEPEFGMGYQKMTDYEINQTVSRLYYVKENRERVYDRPKQANLNNEGIKDMLDRLTQKTEEKTPDTKRTQKHSIYNKMGVVNSFAWKGYN